MASRKRAARLCRQPLLTQGFDCPTATAKKTGPRKGGRLFGGGGGIRTHEGFHPT